VVHLILNLKKIYNMANINLTTGIVTNGQFPVDGDTYFKNRSDVTSLDIDKHAYGFYEGMSLKIVDEEFTWEWREVLTVGEEDGLFPSNFIYPNGLISNGIDYSNREFNFFEFISTPIFNSDLGADLEMEDNVGSILAGTTIEDLQGMTFTQYIEAQNFPTVLAYVSNFSNLVVSGFSTSVVEVGTGYSFTAAMSFDTGNINNGNGTSAGVVSGDALTFDLTNPDGVSYVNNSVVSNADTHTTNSYSLLEGNNDWVFSGTNAAGSTTYKNNKGGDDTVGSIETTKADSIPTNVVLRKTGRFPYIYGMSATDLSSGGVAFYNGQSRFLSSNGSKNVLLNGANEYIQFGYPASYGPLSEIKDATGFPITSSFVQYTVDVTSSGQTTDWTESYYIYQTISPTSVPNKTYQFNK